MVTASREEAERLVAKALSRHIGYTTGAYDLGRIFASLEPFAGRTSAYKDELVAYLANAEGQGSATTSADYRAEILSFSTAMGMLEVVSTREARLVRYASTELGRSILGAKAIGDDDFFRYYMAEVVIRADADFIVPLLIYHETSPPIQINEFFAEYAATLRNLRFEWLISALPERILLERVAAQVHWLKRKKSARGTYEVDIPTANTARHHATPRMGWIEQLGLYDRSTRGLTKFGSDVLRALAGDGRYFWVAPPEDALQALGLTNYPEGQTEDRLTFHGVGAPPSEADMLALVDDLRRVMAAGYPAAKLVHAPQASLQLPIEYVSFRSYMDGKSYDWQIALDHLFLAHKSEFQRYSAKKGKIGFYRAMKS